MNKIVNILGVTLGFLSIFGIAALALVAAG